MKHRRLDWPTTTRPRRWWPMTIAAVAFASNTHAQTSGGSSVPPGSVEAPAATPTTDGSVWTEARVLARAHHSPRVVTAQAQVEALRAYQTFARVPIVGNPVIGIRTMFGVPDNSAATYSLLVGLPIDVSGLRGAWRREAEWGVRSAEAALEAARNETVGQARETFIELVHAEALLRTSLSRADIEREVLARMRQQLAQNATTALDVSMAERELALAEADVAAQRRLREEALGRFREALDLPPTENAHAESLRPPAFPAGMTRESAVQRAMANRGEPRVFQSNAMRLRMSTDRLRAGAIAPIFVGFEFERQGNNPGGQSVGLSAQWELPVVRTAQGDRAVASGEASVAETQWTLARRTVAREAATAWSVLEQRLSELNTITTQAIPAAQRTLTLSEQLFDAGSVDYFRVLLARRELFALRTREVEVLREAWRARVALDRAIGIPSATP